MSHFRAFLQTSIGIAGPSCSGKTALADRLASRLARESPLVVPLDAYYRDLSHLDPADRAMRNFDHPHAIDLELLVTQMRTLAGGGSVEMPVYRFESHSRAPRRRMVEPSRSIIVEGLFTLCWKEIRALFHTRVFIDAPDALCLARRLQRDARARGRTAEAVRRQYERTVRPMCERYVLPTRRFAQVVVRADQAPEEMADAVLDHIAHNRRRE